MTKKKTAAQAKADQVQARRDIAAALEEDIYSTLSRLEVIRLGLVGLREAREADGRSLVSLELIAFEAIEGFIHAPSMLRAAADLDAE